MHHGVRRTVEQIAEPPDVGQPRPRVGPGGFQQHMIGLIFAQHVVDQIGGKGHLLAGLALAGVLPVDQSADDGHLAEGAFQQGALLHPVGKLVVQNILGKQRGGVGHRLQAVTA